MPFTTTTTAPALDATVTVKFAGLMLLKSNANNGLDVGINQLTDGTHEFQVILVVHKPDERPHKINQRPNLVRLVRGPLIDTFTINVEPDPGTGVQAFAPTAKAFDFSSLGNHPLDFRWALNMRELHEGADFNDGARPIATVNAGTLYTPTLIRPEIGAQLKKQGVIKTSLPRFAADLGIAIDLPSPTSQVVLSWFVAPDERTRYVLPRRLDDRGTKYTVVLMNDPPTSNPASHDELEQYYKVLEVNGAAIPTDEQYQLDYTGDPTTDEIPCMSVLLHP